MRRFLIILYILATVPQIVQADTNIHVTGEIILKKNGRLYIDKGRSDGVEVGQKFKMFYDGRDYGGGIIAWVGDDISYARLDSLSFRRILYLEPLEAKILLERPLRIEGGTLHLPFFGRLNLKPSEIKTPAEMTAARLIYDGLVAVDSQGEIVPALAHSWEVHGNTYTFYLDHEVKFHSGKTLDARDVAYSLVELAKAPSATPASSFIMQVDGYEDVHFGNKNELRGIFIPNKYTIAITTKDIFTPFLKYLAGPAGYIIPRVERSQTLPTPIGTGPFKVVRMAEDLMTLSAYSEYFETVPALDSLVFIRYKNLKEAALDFELGKLDLLCFDSASDDDLLTGGGFSTRKFHTSSTVILGFQCQRRYQKNLELSQALQYLLDKDSIVRVLLGNSARKASGLIPPMLDTGSGYTPDYYFAPSEAKSKISQIEGIPQELNLYFDDTDPALKSIAGYIAGQLRQAGLKTNVRNAGPGGLDRQIALSSMDMYLFRYDLPVMDLDAFFYPLFSTRLLGQTNFFYYKNSRLEQFLDGARRFQDVYTRNDIYSKSEELIMENPPMVVLYHPIMTVISRRDLSGFEPMPGASLNLRRAYYQMSR